MIGLWGPRARDVLRGDHGDDLSNGAFPFLSGRSMGAAPPSSRNGSTYVGELGWELYVEPGWAVQIWDRLWTAGGDAGIAPGGYRVLDSLRIEKGYRYFGTDLTMLDTPWEAGLGFCVRSTRGTSTAGRRSSPRWSGGTSAIRTLAIGGEDPVTVYGGEAVHLDGAGGRAAAQRDVRVHRPADDRVRLPAGRARDRARSAGRGVRRARARPRSSEDALYRPGRRRIRV